MKFQPPQLFSFSSIFERSFALILVTFYFSFSQSNSASGQTNWVHPYDSITSGFYNICFDSQKNLYAVGYVRPNGRPFDGFAISGYGYEDGLLCKTDSSGQVQWLKTMGASSTDRAKFVFLKQNMLYVGADVTNNGGITNLNIDSISINIPAFPSVYNGYIAQFDTTGVFQWASFLPGNIHDMKMDDAGNSYATSGDFDSLYLDIVSPVGTKIFHRGLNYRRYAAVIATNYNGGIAIAQPFEDSITFMGNQFFGYGSSDILLAQLSNTGSFIGASVIGGAGKEYVSGLSTDSYGNLIMQGVWGTTVNCLGTIISGADHRYFFLSINPSGSILSYDDNDFRFMREWKVSGRANCVENANHEFITSLSFVDTVIAGNDTLTTHNFGGYEGTGLILKYDVNGQLLWYRKFAESTNVNNTGHASLFLSECDENRNFVCGQMNEHVIIDSTDYDLQSNYIAFSGQIVDTTFDFTLGTNGFERPVNANDIVVFPNPTNGSFNIYTSGYPTDWQLEFIDVNGTILFKQKISGQQKNYMCRANELNLASGIYFVKISSGGATVVRKLLVE